MAACRRLEILTNDVGYEAGIDFHQSTRAKVCPIIQNLVDMLTEDSGELPRCMGDAEVDPV